MRLHYQGLLRLKGCCPWVCFHQYLSANCSHMSFLHGLHDLQTLMCNILCWMSPCFENLRKSSVDSIQVRAVSPSASRDYDIFFSSVALLVGGILCFQGWRLDPLLLFGQILTITAAIAFGVEVSDHISPVAYRSGRFMFACSTPFGNPCNSIIVPTSICSRNLTISGLTERAGLDCTFAWQYQQYR